MAKAGRNSAKCKFYRTYNTRIVNKARRLERHLKSHVKDEQARNAFKLL